MDFNLPQDPCPEKCYNRSVRRNFRDETASAQRLHFLASGVILIFLIIVGRLFQLQILGHETYRALAASEHEVVKNLPPERGEIYLKDRVSGKLFPVATNRDTYTVFIDATKIQEADKLSQELAQILNIKKEEILNKIKPNDPYEPIVRGVSEAQAEKILQKKFVGIGFEREPRRFYPEGAALSQITGFLGDDERGRTGKYGLEGYFEKELRGRGGYLYGEKDALGRLISAQRVRTELPEDGATILLTIDRTIQFFVCEKLKEYVKKFDAQGGVVVISNPESGAILAMCSVPNFDANDYNKVKDFSVFNNQAIFESYEPGSIFKPFTMAAGLDSGAVEPATTYEDKGVVKIGAHEITNSDLKTHGTQTMTQVLEKSLNTGVVFVVRKVGREIFKRYVDNFGFGEPTGIELTSESSGDTSNLGRRGEIYSVTASFGQGISVTPIQLVSAFGAIANGGKLMKPYIIEEIRSASGLEARIEPKLTRQVISPHAANVLASMLTAVVENGHGKRAGVPGYFVAGKTGTAQIPHPSGGYYKDETIGSFVGFAPTTNPRFVMMAKLTRPQGVKWAESTAAPLFGEIAKFLLNYLEVPPERK